MPRTPRPSTPNTDAEASLTSRRAQQSALAVALASFAVAVALGVVLHRHHGPMAWEELAFRRATGWHHELHGLSIRPMKRWLLAAMVAVGEPLPFAACILAMAAAALRSGHARIVACTVAAPIFAVLLTEHLGKPVVQRLHETSSSYPSGHSTGAAAVALTAWLLHLQLTGRRPPRWKEALLALVPIGTGVGVVLLHWHYPTDAIGGWAVGIGTVLAAGLATGLISGSPRH